MQPTIKNDLVPKPVLNNILQFLPKKDFALKARVCKSWQTATKYTNDDLPLWAKLTGVESQKFLEYSNRTFGAHFLDVTKTDIITLQRVDNIGSVCFQSLANNFIQTNFEVSSSAKLVGQSENYLILHTEGKEVLVIDKENKQIAHKILLELPPLVGEIKCHFDDKAVTFYISSGFFKQYCAKTFQPINNSPFEQFISAEGCIDTCEFPGKNLIVFSTAGTDREIWSYSIGNKSRRPIYQMSTFLRGFATNTNYIFVLNPAVLLRYVISPDGTISDKPDKTLKLEVYKPLDIGDPFFVNERFVVILCQKAESKLAGSKRNPGYYFIAIDIESWKIVYEEKCDDPSNITLHKNFVMQRGSMPRIWDIDTKTRISFDCNVISFFDVGGKEKEKALLTAEQPLLLGSSFPTNKFFIRRSIQPAKIAKVPSNIVQNNVVAQAPIITPISPPVASRKVTRISFSRRVRNFFANIGRVFLRIFCCKR